MLHVPHRFRLSKGLLSGSQNLLLHAAPEPPPAPPSAWRRSLQRGPGSRTRTCTAKSKHWKEKNLRKKRRIPCEPRRAGRARRCWKTHSRQTGKSGPSQQKETSDKSESESLCFWTWQLCNSVYSAVSSTSINPHQMNERDDVPPQTTGVQCLASPVSKRSTSSSRFGAFGFGV